MSISVYGIESGSDLNNASTEALERLFQDLGRNGETAQSGDIRQEVSRILSNRRQAGVIMGQEGSMHHPV